MVLIEAKSDSKRSFYIGAEVNRVFTFCALVVYNVYFHFMTFLAKKALVIISDSDLKVVLHTPIEFIWYIYLSGKIKKVK